MRVSVRKWGNSPAVRIPISIMHAAHLKIDQAMEIHEEQGRVIIEPVIEKDLSLSQLLDGVRADNLHEEVDFGGPMGREIF